jgi:hypothetical protein
VNHAGNVLDLVLVNLLKNFVKKNFSLPAFIFNIDRIFRYTHRPDNIL